MRRKFVRGAACESARSVRIQLTYAARSIVSERLKMGRGFTREVRCGGADTFVAGLGDPSFFESWNFGMSEVDIRRIL